MLYDSLKSETFDHLCALLFNFTFFLFLFLFLWFCFSKDGLDIKFWFSGLTLKWTDVPLIRSRWSGDLAGEKKNALQKVASAHTMADEKSL